MTKDSTIRGTSDETHDLPPPIIPNYKLIKLIGEGSFGQVWVAMDATDSPCAIKIIYKRKSKKDLFWKEFEGVKNYLPISRSNLGLVTILHVGKSDDDCFYYYTMELADDLHSGKHENWQSYEAKSLSSYIKTIDSPCNLDEFGEIALNLSNGLAHLHTNGLVHRDIKPSNVIFVNGVSKLADVGLVSIGSEASTFIGTTGYIPPEGPGTPRADVYALGKSLYELLTGNNVGAFPTLPTLMGGDLSKEKSFAAYNHVISDACTPSASERIENGQSLRDAFSYVVSPPAKSLPVHGTFRRKIIYSIIAVITALLLYDWKFNKSAGRHTIETTFSNGLESFLSLPQLVEAKSSIKSFLVDEKPPENIFSQNIPPEPKFESNLSDSSSIETPKILPKILLPLEGFDEVKSPPFQSKKVTVAEQRSDTQPIIEQKAKPLNIDVRKKHISSAPTVSENVEILKSSPALPEKTSPTNILNKKPKGEISAKKNNYTKIEIAPSQQETASLESNENVSALLSQNSSKAIEEIEPPLPKIKTADNLPSTGKPFIWDMMNLNMPWIPPGEFTMGSRESEIGREEDESPLSLLKISNGFWMSNVETTQYQYQMVTHSNPSKFKSSTSPVENVSWMDAKKFCTLITKVAHEELSLPKVYIFDLPTEQEWEYSCRAGTVTAFSFGNSISQNLANFRDQNPKNNVQIPNSTTPVASYPANKWNLYDMHGNVAEWTSTIYIPYLSSRKPKFSTSEKFKVARGGNWTNYSKFCRSAYRNRFLPSFKSSGLGFRLVLRKLKN